MKLNVNKMVKLAMLAALAVVLMLYIHFPLIPAAPFLEYEPGDIPALVGAFIFGPSAGFTIILIVSLVQAATVSASSGIAGAVMHLIASGTMVIVAGLIYKKIHNIKGAMLALAAGTISMTAVMIPLNLIITPLFMNVKPEIVLSMILPIIVPFNLMKAGINSAITVIVYKSVGKVLRAEAVKVARSYTKKAV